MLKSVVGNLVDINDDIGVELFGFTQQMKHSKWESLAEENATYQRDVFSVNNIHLYGTPVSHTMKRVNDWDIESLRPYVDVIKPNFVIGNVLNQEANVYDTENTS